MVKSTARSSDVAEGPRIFAASGHGSSSFRNAAGASMSVIREAGLIPSFATSGVPL